MSEKKETLIIINGLEIKTNSIYKITNKLDSSAPSGFIKEGTTKLPSIDVGNTVPCRFITTNKARGIGIFDTGFYKDSPCYATVDKELSKQQVKSLRNHIVNPYEDKHGRGVLDHKNEDFWKEFGVDLYTGRYFVTSNVDDLLGLYIAMSGFELTPKDKVGNPKFNESQYCIEDKDKVTTIKQERSSNLMNSITKFGVLLETDKTKLLNILRYIRIIGVNEDIDTLTLNSLFFEWLHKSDENPKKFLKTYKLASSDSTSEIIDLYTLVNRLVIKKIINKEGSEYSYKGEYLGMDLKTVATNLNNKKELEEIKIELLEI